MQLVANFIHSTTNNGVKITNGKVIAWFPKDSLDKKGMNEITGMLKKALKFKTN